MGYLTKLGSPVLQSALLFREQKKALPQTLIFFVTSRCNARCDFCLYYDQITNPVAKERELTIPEVEKIARNYGNLHYLGLSGGEPFVRKDLEQICQAFIDHCSTQVIDIPSNFYYTDTMVETMEPLVRKNPNVIFELQMSIDQIGEAHNESRKVKDLYRKAIQSFRALSEIREEHSNLKLKISIVHLESNREHLDEIVSELSREVQYDRIQLTFPHSMVPEGEDLASEEELAEYTTAADHLTRRATSQNPADLHTVGILSVKSIYHRLLAEAVKKHRNVGSYCEAGRYIVVINEKGDVFPCEPLWHPIGNLRDHNYEMKTVLNGKTYSDFRDRFLGEGKCNCTWSCAMHSTISVTPKYLPQLAWNAFGIVMSRLLGRAS